MKALVYTGDESLIYREYELIDRKDYEVTVEVKGTGICGSDLHAFLGHDQRRVPPMVLGHEVFGKVIDGPEHVGKYVAINPIISCDECEYCLEKRPNLCPNRYMIGMQTQGGFAQYMNIHKKNVIPMSDSTYSKFGALAEPVATSLHAVNLIKKSNFRDFSKSNAIVIGAGSIGLLCAILLKHQGCKNIGIYEKNPLRHPNIDTIEGVNTIKSIDEEIKYDIVVDAVGIEVTRGLSANLVQSGGTIMHIGLGDNNGGIDFRKITLSEVKFLGTYTYTNEEFSQAVEYLDKGTLNKDLGWIEERKMEDGQKAFEEILKGQARSAKIVLTSDIL